MMEKIIMAADQRYLSLVNCIKLILKCIECSWLFGILKYIYYSVKIMILRIEYTSRSGQGKFSQRIVC